ncbi:MAG: hypothetical protein FGM44_09210, partial [Limnohabitans sp.]|nr:hypothetical protein [Limnohabitans sp.]
MDFARGMGTLANAAANSSMLDLSAASRSLTVGTAPNTTTYTFNSSDTSQRVAFSGSVTLALGSAVSLSGTVGFASSGSGLMLAGNSIAADIQAGSVGIGVRNGSFGLLLNNNDTYALEASGGFYLSGGNFASVSADMALLRLNTTGAALTAQTLQIGGLSYNLPAFSALATPVIQVTNLSATLNGSIALSGDFAFERDSATGNLEVVAASASASLRAGDMRAGVSNANVTLVVKSTGVLLEASGSADLALGNTLTASATSVRVAWNSTSADATGSSIQVADTTRTFGALQAGLRDVVLTGAAVVVNDFFRLDGSLSLHQSTSNIKLAADTVGTAGVNEATTGLTVDLFTMGGSNLNARIGVEDGQGLSLTGVEFGLAVMSAQNDASRRWTTLKASAQGVSMTGISGVTASGTNLAVTLNLADNAADAVVDYAAGKTSLSVALSNQSTLVFDIDGSQGALVQASGQLSLGLFSFVQLDGVFAFKRAEQSITLADGSTVQAQMLTVGATGASGFAGLGKDGSSPLGLSFTNLDFALALASDTKNNQRSWVSLQANAASASFSGVSGLTLSATQIGLTVNQASRSQDAVMDGVVAPIAIAGGGAISELKPDGAQGRQLQASATVSLDVLGFVQLDGGLSFQKSTESVVLSGESATRSVDVLRVGGTSLNVFAGINGNKANRMGLNLGNVEFGMALMLESGVATPRQWLSLQATASSAAFLGVSDLTVSARDIAIEINRASSDGKVVDYSAGKTSLSVATSRSTSLALSMAGSQGVLTRASGHLELNVYGFVQLEGDFALNSSDATLKLAGGVNTDVRLLTLGAHDVRAFAGVAGASSDRVGLSLSGVDVALVLAGERNAATPRQWISLQGSAAQASLSGVSGVTLAGQDMALQLNQAASDGSLLDYAAQALTISTGPSTNIALNMKASDGRLLRASGELHVGVSDFFDAQGSFALERRVATLHTADKVGTPANESADVSVDLLTLGGVGITALAGVNAASATATGLSLQETSFGLVMARERTSGTPRQWSALKASAASAGFVGIDGLTMTGSNLSVAINQGDAQGVVLDFSSTHALNVATGTSSTLTMDLDGSLGASLQAQGHVAVDLFGFARFESDLAIQRSTGSVRLTGDAADTNVNLLTIGLNDASGFVGMNGGSVDAVGLGFSHAQLGMVIASDLNNTARTWTALKGSVASASFSGIDGLTMAATNVAVTINRADVINGKVVDWAAKSMSIMTGPSTSITLNMAGASGQLLSAAATLDVNLFGFFQVSGSFGLESKQQTLTLSDGSDITANTLTLGATNVNAFAGAQADGADKLGLDLTGVNFALLLATDTRQPQRHFTTLQAGAGQAAFAGVDGLTLSGSNLAVAINRGVVVPGTPSSSTVVNTQYTLDLAGTATGQLRFDRNTSTSTVTLDGTETDAELITKLTAGVAALTGIGASNVTVKGSKLAGFTIEFTGSLSGTNVSGLAVTAIAPTVTTGVTTTTAAVAGINEAKLLVLETQRVVSSPVSVTVDQVVAASAGSNEVKTLLFTTPYTTKGQYQLSLASAPATLVNVQFLQNDVTNNAANIRNALANLLSTSTSNISVTFDNSFTGGGHRYIIAFSGALALQDIPNLVVTEALSGDILPFNRVQGAAATDEVQRVAISTASTGTFTLSFTDAGQTYTTTALAIGASAADVQSALNTALGSAGTVNVTLESTSIYRISMGGALSGRDVAALVVKVNPDPVAPTGSFTISWNGLTTNAIAYSNNTTTQAANILAAITSRFGWSSNDVSVSFDPGHSDNSLTAYRLNFSNGLAAQDISDLSTSSASLVRASIKPYNLAQGRAAVAEVQRIALTTSASNANFTLTWGGHTTTTLHTGDTTATLQAAVTAAFGSGITVGFWNGKEMLLQFGGAQSGIDVAAVTVSASTTAMSAQLSVAQQGSTTNVAAMQNQTLVIDYVRRGVSVPTGALTHFDLNLDGASGELTEANGTLQLDAFGFLQAQGSFHLVKRDASLKLGDGNTVNVDLLSLGAHIGNAFAGVDGGTTDAVGLNLQNLDLGLALASEKPNIDTPLTPVRRWMALQGTAGTVALTGVTGLTLQGSDLSLQMQRAATDSSLLDFSQQPLVVLTGSADSSPSVTLTLDASQGEVTRASGQLNLDVFGFFRASGEFGIEKRIGSVTLADLPATTSVNEAATAVNVNQLLIGGHDLAAFAGINGGLANATGLQLSGVSFGLALQSERLTQAQRNQGLHARQWTSLQSEVESAGFVGMDGLTLSVDSLHVDVNRAATDNTVVDYRNGATTLNIITGPAGTLAMTLDGSQGALIRAAGHVNIDLFGFVQLEGDLAFEKAAASRTVKLADGTDAQVTVLTVGGRNLSAFAGLHGGQSDATGLNLGSMDFALALLSDTQQTTRSWTSLQASAANAGLVGIDGLTVQGRDLQLQINRAAHTTDAVVDYGLTAATNDGNARNTELTLATGPSTSVQLTMDGQAGQLLRASGYLQLDAFGFLQASGNFALEKRTASVVLNDGVVSEDATAARAASELQVDLLTIGASGVDAFAGIDGNTDHRLGLSLQGVNLGLAIMTERLTAAQVTAGNTARHFTTLKAQADTAGLVGIDGVTA